MVKPAQKHTIGVADFKARCLELLEGVARGRRDHHHQSASRLRRLVPSALSSLN